MSEAMEDLTPAELAQLCCEVLITGPDAQWMSAFARRLVEDGQAAAGHLMPMRTIYRWQGAVEDESEMRLILHTRRELVAAIAERTKREHPFEVACVVATPMIDGGPDYLRWILEQTTAPE